jgi:hypothetical protein
MITAIQIINYFTQTLFYTIWKNQYNITCDIESGFIDEWTFIEQNPFTEATWGKVLNK